MTDLGVGLFGTRLKNPLIVASGPLGYFPPAARKLHRLKSAGAVTVKGTSSRPWPGNAPPRLAETPAGLLNSIGLENEGVEWLKKECLPDLLEEGMKVIVNVVGQDLDEYVAVAEALAGEEVFALEMNVSCPNVGSCLKLGEDPVFLRDSVQRVRDASPHPLVVKLSPNVGSRRIVDLSRAAEDGGAAAVSLINTLRGMAIDVEKKAPSLGAVFGGLSGPAIKPVALAMVWDVAGAVEIPVIGMGGISSGRDALEFLMAGASAVAVGTAQLADPLALDRMLGEIRDYMARHSVRAVEELVGVARGDHRRT